MFNVLRSTQIINLGSGQPITLTTMIDTLEEVLGIEAERQHLPEQPGDVPQTWADVQRAECALDYSPETALVDGLSHLVDWLRTGPVQNRKAERVHVPSSRPTS